MEFILNQLTQSSLIWAFVLILIIAAIFTLQAVIGYKSVSEDAVSDYEYKFKEGMVDTRLSKKGYIRAYKRCHVPRAQALIAITLFSCAILTLPALGLLNYVYYSLWELNNRDEAFTPGFLVHALSMFFMTIMFWASIAYFAAKSYHSKTPISFKDEMLKEID